MAGYLLLRDNKESGPYSLADIIAKKLKPHDLIWVEGKSAAWRYPEEITELSSHVEHSASSSLQVDEGMLKSSAPEPTEASVPASHIQFTPPQGERKEHNARKIAVILPGIQKRAATQPVVHAEAPKSAPEVRAAGLVEKNNAPASEPEFTPSSTVQSNRQYVHHTVTSPVNSASSKSFDQLKYVVWGVALLMGGIVAGIGVDRAFHTKNAVAPDRAASAASIATNVADSNASQSANSFNTPSTVIAAPSEKPVASRPVVLKHWKNAEVVNSTPGQETKAETAAAAAAEVSAEKEKKKVVDLESAKATLRSQLAVSNGKYKVGAFGGINNLQVTLSNNSSITVDMATVKVDYVLANKKVYKTEILSFRDIRPGASIMQEAPKCSRGVKVNCYLGEASARELGIAVQN